VWHADGYVEIKDRLKDIIISGGENISTIEVEDVLYRHPAVLEAAVVARPDEKWGETPCAFVALKTGHGGTREADIIAWCREHLAGFKVPKTVVFGELPKTSPARSRSTCCATAPRRSETPFSNICTPNPPPSRAADDPIPPPARHALRPPRSVQGPALWARLPALAERSTPTPPTPSSKKPPASPAS
jgi:hypothetical protein